MNIVRQNGNGIDRINVSAYSIPTDAPEADGTYRWNKTVLVIVKVTAQGATGLGYTYADTATAHFVQTHFFPILLGADPLQIPELWKEMLRAVRNLGRQGIAATAISAVDVALWDLKAKLIHRPLIALLGAARKAVPVYGSGGFTSYSPKQLREQLQGWVKEGISQVKMKIGTHPEEDLKRVTFARETIGNSVALFVDANGAYSRKQALGFAEKFIDLGVTWFEEPVSADDLDGLRLLRDHSPGCMEIAAGEYGYDLQYFRRMLEAGAVDVLQADASRCGGVTGFLKVADVCESFGLPLSAHCAPSLHVHVSCAVTADFRHIEYFHDHVRIETILFDGAAVPLNGMVHPDYDRFGLGLEFKQADARHFLVWSTE